ncbi:kinase-like protein [Gigaspora margarita]|uniref:Kinase-like protein n=1 Tax=Gigaspora margarita TaxID=4874 RepID=A0A8H4ERP1_GIGMA|nr:kinase-like protein [Gigaspora margarita]
MENLIDNYNKYHNIFLQADSATISSNSCKVFSQKYNKTMILSKLVFCQKYTLENFINDLKQYKKVGLHENILKFMTVIKQSVNEIIFIHEYASDGTLRQYLKQNFNKINWNDKLRFAKQLVSAVKCLHDNDLIHLNLYTDPQYLQNIETYKLNKSSDIYSIGVLLWEISSGIIPFKTESYCISNLLNAIVNGKREDVISETPKNYINIYTKCWQHNSNQRPNIQYIFNNLDIINYNDIITECNKNMNKDKLISEMENSNSTESLNYYTNLRGKAAKELMLISSIIKLLNENSTVNNDNQNNLLNLTSFVSISNVTKSIPISLVNVSNQDNINDKQKFLYDLNQLFITQFNIQGVMNESESSIIYCLKKYFVENNKNPKDILKQYNNYKYRYYFTSLIGFFYEYGIGTIIDYYKAFEMYTQASKNFNSLNKLDNLLKENQIIGLISLGLLYLRGKGVILNQQKDYIYF